MKKLCLVALSITLAVVLACPALATSSEEEIAAEYLKEQGILEGDQNGDMNLASGLTRAQLAAVLTRLNGNQEHVQAEQEFYISQCKFPDVPAWARLYVGYCYFNSLMVGYDTGAFGADDGVTLLRLVRLFYGTWIFQIFNGITTPPARRLLTQG